MLLNQLFDEDTWTFTYLLADPVTKDAVIIDPVAEKVDRDLKLIQELGLNLRYTLDTHVHADHITGSGTLRERTGAKTVVSAAAKVSCADVGVKHGDRIAFGSYEAEVRSTPGHTDGCITFVVKDASQTMAFTGDALFVRGSGRTDFQQGDARTLYRSVHDQIYSLPDDTVIYPGHDYRGNTATTVADEKAHNPRLNSGVDEQAFVEIMDNLNLANPKRMDVAVPANLACGRPEAPAPADFKTVVPHEVTTLDEYRIIDVRQPEEFNGELGHLPGAELVPLSGLPNHLASWPLDDKLLVVCRSGGRAGVACDFLVSQGFADVTNLEGGMLSWRSNLNAPAMGAQR